MIHKENINTKHLLGLTMLPYNALRGGEVRVHTHTHTVSLLTTTGASMTYSPHADTLRVQHSQTVPGVSVLLVNNIPSK